MSGGWKIIKTMGTRITKVTPLEGVSAHILPEYDSGNHNHLPYFRFIAFGMTVVFF
jgi:hypothetical protein